MYENERLKILGWCFLIAVVIAIFFNCVRIKINLRQEHHTFVDVDMLNQAAEDDVVPMNDAWIKMNRTEPYVHPVDWTKKSSQK